MGNLCGDAVAPCVPALPHQHSIRALCQCLLQPLLLFIGAGEKEQSQRHGLFLGGFGVGFQLIEVNPYDARVADVVDQLVAKHEAVVHGVGGDEQAGVWGDTVVEEAHLEGVLEALVVYAVVGLQAVGQVVGAAGLLGGFADEVDGQELHFGGA